VAENNHIKLARISQETRIITLKRIVITGLAAHLLISIFVNWWNRRILITGIWGCGMDSAGITQWPVSFLLNALMHLQVS